MGFTRFQNPNFGYIEHIKAHGHSNTCLQSVKSTSAEFIPSRAKHIRQKHDQGLSPTSFKFQLESFLPAFRIPTNMKNTVLCLSMLSGLAIASIQPQTYVIPTGQFNGTTAADSIIGLSAFDVPHIAVNSGSAYQWWYFDAVSHNADALLVAQFYPGWFPESSAVLLQILWPNGTLFPFTPIPVGDLQLSTVGDGSQGVVDDGAMTWVGSSDLGVYHLTLDLPQAGISGKITMPSRAPAHVACGLNTPGGSFNFAPYLSWANTIPDSHATVNLTINGTDLSFSGSGYHDQVFF